MQQHAEHACDEQAQQGQHAASQIGKVAVSISLLSRTAGGVWTLPDSCTAAGPSKSTLRSCVCLDPARHGGQSKLCTLSQRISMRMAVHTRCAGLQSAAHHSHARQPQAQECLVYIALRDMHASDEAKLPVSRHPSLPFSVQSHTWGLALMSVCVAEAQPQLFWYCAVLHERRPQGSLRAGCGSVQPCLQAPELCQQGRPSQELCQLHISQLCFHARSGK